MKTDALTNPTVKAAIEALQSGKGKAWSALFEPDAELYDDGNPRALKEFTRNALGHERFTSIDCVENNGPDLTGASIRSTGAIFRPASGFSSRLRVRSTDLISGRQPNRDQTGETL
jgi:hypothetical protein